MTSFSTLALSTGEDWKVDALNDEALPRKVANVVEAQQGLYKVVEERVKKIARQRQAASKGATKLCGGTLCDGGKGKAVGLDAEFGEHVDRSLVNCNGG